MTDSLAEGTDDDATRVLSLVFELTHDSAAPDARTRLAMRATAPGLLRGAPRRGLLRDASRVAAAERAFAAWRAHWRWRRRARRSRVASWGSSSRRRARNDETPILVFSG